jgi:hypothetical protein
MSLSSSPGRARHGLRAVCTAVAAVTVAGLGLAVPATPALAATGHPALVRSATTSNVTRVSGSTRIDTAVATSQDQFAATGSAKAVVLARSDTFPDALAGGPLAAKVGGPLLLTSSASLDAAVSTEIQRVAPKGATVYILGGTAAISTSVDTALTGLGYLPQRISGKDRFATAVAIADQMGDPTTVFEATGLNFPDALAGGPAAIKTGGVILLTNGTAQADATTAYLNAHAGGTHYALGGPAAKADPSATPLVGDDRFWTAAGVAAQFFPTAATMGIATAMNFPDALAAGPDLAAKGAPLLLVSGSGALPEAVAVHLLWTTNVTTKAVVFGGTASVGDDVASQIGDLVGAGARAVAMDTSATYTGQFGVMAQRLTQGTFTANSTLVVDATSGDATLYNQNGVTSTVTGVEKSRAQLAALPIDNPDALESAVNALYADLDTQLGITTTDVFELFTLNAGEVLLDPVAPPSVRFATYVALASDDPLTFVTPGVKDSLGRVGIKIWTPTGSSATDKSEISFLFDPTTLLPLEHTVLDETGAVVARNTVTSLTTATTMPADPYTP